jgi:hypothetical protein
MTLVLIGAHGAGKTTIGRALAQRLGWVFQEELGLTISQQLRPTTQTAADPQEALDDAIFSAELARDACSLGLNRVVETWHPGNLAYASVRSPAVVAQYYPQILASCTGALVLPVRRLQCPQWEPGDPAFFAEVGRQSEVFAARLGLRLLSPLHNNGSLEASLEAALNILGKL